MSLLTSKGQFHSENLCVMPEEETVERAREDERKGSLAFQAPSPRKPPARCGTSNQNRATTNKATLSVPRASQEARSFNRWSFPVVTRKNSRANFCKSGEHLAKP